MVQRDIDAIVAGHVCLDIIPGFNPDHHYTRDEVFTPGKLVEVGKVAVCTGGPVSNTGIGLVKLGNQVSFMAKTGGDDFGRLTLESLKRWADVEGVSVSPGESSSYTLAIAPTGIDRIFFHAPGTNHTFSADDVDYDLCSRARIFHLGYPPLMRRLYSNDGEQLAEIFRRVKEKGTTTSLDMALPDPSSEAGKANWRKILQRTLPFVDIFHPSGEEALFMVNPEKWKAMRAQAAGDDILDLFVGKDLSELSEQILAWGPAVVSHKCGHRGFFVRTADQDRLTRMGGAAPADVNAWAKRELWAPAYRVDRIASATGSGDSSLAGFTTAFLKQMSPEDCVAAGNALGYQNLHALDAISGIRDWPATLQIMADRSLPRHPLNAGDGWRYDEAAIMGHGPNDTQL